jgi:hypothetical protein
MALSHNKNNCVQASYFTDLIHFQENNNYSKNSKNINYLIKEQAVVRGILKTFRRKYYYTGKSTERNIENKKENKTVEGKNANEETKNEETSCSSSSSTYKGVGWVVDDDFDDCMICGINFGFFTLKHHCRSCGNLICDSCSPYFVVIYELSDMGKLRICVQCYYGQKKVYMEECFNITAVLKFENIYNNIFNINNNLNLNKKENFIIIKPKTLFLIEAKRFYLYLKKEILEISSTTILKLRKIFINICYLNNCDNNIENNNNNNNNNNIESELDEIFNFEKNDDNKNNNINNNNDNKLLEINDSTKKNILYYICDDFFLKTKNIEIETQKTKKLLNLTNNKKNEIVTKNNNNNNNNNNVIVKSNNNVNTIKSSYNNNVDNNKENKIKFEVYHVILNKKNFDFNFQNFDVDLFLAKNTQVFINFIYYYYA